MGQHPIHYGAKIVGGVTPGRAGRDVYGVPVYDCVRDVVAKHGPVDGSIISVPPGFTRDAAFEALEKEEDAAADPDEPRIFTGGRSAFIHKGTNGRWKGVLSEGELELYEEAKRRVLSPDCAKWLEEGGPVQGSGFAR